MKSLKESLFDDDLATRKYKFGDYYKLSPTKYRSGYFDNFIKFINKSFKTSKLMKDTGASNPFHALVEVILNLPLYTSGNDFHDAVQDCLIKNYFKSGYGAVIFVGSQKDYTYIKDMLDDDIKEILISFNNFRLYFERK